MGNWPTPRLPVMGWQAMTGHGPLPLHCMLDLPGCHFTTSGRASITLAFELLGVQPGEPVLLPSYHCPTMIAPAAALHAIPRFYSIDGRGTPHLGQLADLDLRGVRVMLAAHYFGAPQPMAMLRHWCDARGIALVEDCAHALFGMSDGRPIGSWGDIAIGSLTKFLPVPEGGCIVLNRGQQLPALSRRTLRAELKAWLDIVEEGARHGRLVGLNRAITAPVDLLRGLRRRLGGTMPLAEAAEPLRDDGANHAIDLSHARSALQAACRQLARALPRRRIVERRRAHYAHLVRELSGLDGVKPLLPELPQYAVPYVLPLWVRDPDPGYQSLRRQRVPVFRWDMRWPQTPPLPFDAGAAWSHHVLQLACHQDLSAQDLKRIVLAVKQCLADGAGPSAPIPLLAANTDSLLTGVH